MVRVGASTVAGVARAPPSKSYTHRAVLAAGYADGATVVDPLASADTAATARAVEAFGGSVSDDAGVGRARDGPVWSVAGFDGRPSVPADVVDCENSGTTTRLATATAGLVDGTTVLTGDASLRTRPQGPLLAALSELGARARSTRENGQAPLVVEGPLSGGRVEVTGDVSSQFVTALLFAGARTAEGLTVAVTTPLKSAPYVEMTREVLAEFGVDTARTDEGFRVPGRQRYRAERYRVPGDFSSMSYLLAAGAVAAPEGVVVENARPGAQGDAAIVEHVRRMGAPVEWDREAGRLRVERASLSGIVVDVGDTPDLLPTLAVLGAVADGDTRIENCEHVRYKETDRVAAMATELERMGVPTTEREDELLVHGGEADLRGATVDGRDDHRIAMALSVLALVAGETAVENAHVEVSFPGFYDVLADLGADVRVD
jgi:3-phosphoshikimate 1-carboxyvinyltransferase